MTDVTGGWVGRPMPRKEDLRLLRGKGQYFADRTEPDAATVHFVRSTRPHARIVTLDVARARALDGVLDVFVGKDIAADIPELLIPSLRPQLPGTMRVPPSPLLAVDTVVFAGEPIAVVLARDEFVARDAAELIHIEYEDLPALLDPESALAPDAPRVFPGWPDNLQYELELGDDVSDIFERAAVTVGGRFEVPRTGASPMEPRGARARWDDEAGLSLQVTNQRPHIVQLAISELLDIPYSQLHVTVPRDQGGAFGAKAPIFREEVVIAYLARRTGRCLEWTENREDHFRAGLGQERGQIHDIEMAVDSDGTILAVRDNAVSDTGVGNEGVYVSFVMPFLGVAHLPNAYAIPAVQIHLRCPVTNKPPLVPARSFGEFPTRFALERLIDMAATKLGTEPAEIRRRNLITDFPHTTATGLYYDSGDFAGGFDKLLERIDLPDFRREQVHARAEGRHLGIGFAVGVELSGLSSEVFVALENQPGYGAATVKIDPRGTVQVGYGDCPQGQSHETTFAQVVADEFGISPDDVRLHYGDTRTSPFGSGTVGNRTASYTVSAVVLACRELKRKMALVAAHDMEIDADAHGFDFRDGKVVLRSNPQHGTTFADLARRIIMAPVNLPEGMEAGLEHTSYYEPTVPGMYSCGYHAAIVEVDPETGQCRIDRFVVAEDSGRRINPLIVEGQIHGGVALGIGNTMFEEFVYGEDGQLKTTTLMDYLMPSAADLPHFDTIDASVPTPHTPLGTKGKGEGVPGPVPGALANAIADALAPLEVDITRLPLRAETLWQAIRGAKDETTIRSRDGAPTPA